jgi:hypothetical protein
MCFKLMNEKIKKFKWWHMSFVKLSVLAFALMIAKLWSGILTLDWYWYLIIGIILAIVPAYKLFKK